MNSNRALFVAMWEHFGHIVTHRAPSVVNVVAQSKEVVTDSVRGSANQRLEDEIDRLFPM